MNKNNLQNKCLFEEIIFLIDIVIILISKSQEYYFIYYTFQIKAILDFLCMSRWFIKYAKKIKRGRK